MIVQLTSLGESPSCRVRRNPGGAQKTLRGEEMMLSVQRDKGNQSSQGRGLERTELYTEEPRRLTEGPLEHSVEY